MRTSLTIALLAAYTEALHLETQNKQILSAVEVMKNAWETGVYTNPYVHDPKECDADPAKRVTGEECYEEVC